MLYVGIDVHKRSRCLTIDITEIDSLPQIRKSL
jgi:hypothetical protein